MLDDVFSTEEENSPKSLADEIDVLPWSELVRHFAFGRLYVARDPLSLLEAGEAMKNDQADRLKSAMEKGLFGAPSNEEAELWFQNKQMFEVLVIKPFVVISPVK